MNVKMSYIEGFLRVISSVLYCTLFAHLLYLVIVMFSGHIVDMLHNFRF